MKLPAGKYFIGDPCYAIPDKDWSEFCNVLFSSGNDEITEFMGFPMYAAGTAYGDGCYPDNMGNAYGVDAGLIGVVPMKLCKKYSIKEMKRLGVIHEFKSDFKASSEGGVFHFDDIEIDTAGDNITDDDR